MTKKIHPPTLSPRRRIYISGPITGRDPQTVRKAFDQAARYLRALDYLPVIPLDNGLPATATYRQHMERDLQLLDACWGILMLSEWGESPGAREELEHAIKGNKRIFFLPDEKDDE